MAIYLGQPPVWVPIPAEHARRLRTLGGWFAMLIGSSAVVLAVLVVLLGAQLLSRADVIISFVYIFALTMDVFLAMSGFLVLNPWRHLRGDQIELLLVQRSRQMLGWIWGFLFFFALGLTFFLLGVMRTEIRRGGHIDGWDWVFVVVAYLPIALQGLAFFVGRRLYPRPNL
ncbi:hypothetical protein [Crossiella cryophila]|uniref:Uncharacterized protein n=1 Tax=Crossiella cryophila TaxID=43355 RepID=A0A7W7CI85_9PSEU|nr:hypothetical protein [Crossiella cryophila]MBB4681689.1 hypothetical protein [Crossiella cryophila]